MAVSSASTEVAGVKGGKEMTGSDYGMVFIPEKNVFCKVYRDNKGLFIRLPKSQEKIRLKAEKRSGSEK